VCIHQKKYLCLCPEECRSAAKADASAVMFVFFFSLLQSKKYMCTLTIRLCLWKSGALYYTILFSILVGFPGLMQCSFILSREPGEDEAPEKVGQVNRRIGLTA
jgi:hypothetical protein